MSVTDAVPGGARLDLVPPGRRPPRAATLRSLPAFAVVAVAWAALVAMQVPGGRELAAMAAWLTEAITAGGTGPSVLLALVASLCRGDAGPATGLPHLVAMWVAMTVAMALLCAAPGWRLVREAPDWRAGYGFLAGHLGLWLCFALTAAAAEASLAAAPLAPAGAAALAAAAVALAAAYQWSSAKAEALARMRRAGQGDRIRLASDPRLALRHGLAFGRACLAANGALMALMAVVGAMNVAAMAAIGAAMTAERLAPSPRTARLVGLVLFAASLWLLLVRH